MSAQPWATLLAVALVVAALTLFGRVVARHRRRAAQVAAIEQRWRELQQQRR